MSRRAAWISGFLAVTGVAIGAELYAAFDSSAATTPWTDLLVTYVPEPVTTALIAVLVVWAPLHFAIRYRSARERAMSKPVAAPDPDNTPTEPLVTVATITALATAALTLAATFGLNLSEAQTVAVVAFIGTAAPLVVAVLARRKVYSPASVAKLLGTEERTMR